MRSALGSLAYIKSYFNSVLKDWSAFPGSAFNFSAFGPLPSRFSKLCVTMPFFFTSSGLTSPYIVKWGITDNCMEVAIAYRGPVTTLKMNCQGLMLMWLR